MQLTPMSFLIVCPLVFLAGFIDAIAGGGGLISLPAYLIAGLPAHLASGTNKMGALFGTALSTGKYAKDKCIHYRAAIPAVIGALPGAWLGAQMLMLIPERMVQVFMMVAIPVIAGVMLLRGDKMDKPNPNRSVKTWVCFLIGLTIGMYDGFFGPGTGTFLMLAFSMLCGMDLVNANGTTKLVNLASNLAAMAAFLMQGNVLLALALPAAACSMAGNYIGSVLAVKKGAKVIRPVFFLVLVLLMVTVVYEFLIK